MRQWPCFRKLCEYSSDDTDAYISHMNDHYREESVKAQVAKSGLAMFAAGFAAENEVLSAEALDAYRDALRVVLEKGAF